MKAYTDLEQSKKLAEILPLESADMFYDGVQDLYKEKTYNIPINGSSITVRTGHIITQKDIKANLLLPCWTLAALLSAIPNASLPRNVLGWQCISYKNCICTKGDIADDPVDACVEMIIRLNELNLL